MLQSHFSFLGNSLKTNATIPTLVPKRPNPSMMGDFRPIGANVPRRSILENAYPKTYQQQIVEVWLRRCWLKSIHGCQRSFLLQVDCN
jgi:hypothetical protein